MANGQIKDITLELTTLADGDVAAFDRVADGKTGKITKANLKTALNPTPAETVTAVNTALGGTAWQGGGGASYTTLTAAQFKAAITASTLPVGGWVKITNIGATNLEVMCWTPTANTFNSDVKVLNYDCDSGYMYLEPLYGLVTVECWDDIFGVVRNTAGTWNLITTSGHTPHRVGSISNLSTGDGPRITFAKTDYSDVGSVICGIDDSYVGSFAFVGAAGGLLYADMPMTRRGSIKSFIKYSGGWQKYGPDAANISVATSGAYCLITHPSCELYTGNATTGPELYCYTPCMSTADATTTRIGFRDGTTQIANPAVFQSQFNFERFYEKKFLNADSAIVNSNIWFHMKMMRKFN